MRISCYSRQVGVGCASDQDICFEEEVGRTPCRRGNFERMLQGLLNACLRTFGFNRKVVKRDSRNDGLWDLPGAGWIHFAENASCWSNTEIFSVPDTSQ